jgi:hypothetical protein
VLLPIERENRIDKKLFFARQSAFVDLGWTLEHVRSDAVSRRIRILCVRRSARLRICNPCRLSKH